MATFCWKHLHTGLLQRGKTPPGVTRPRHLLGEQLSDPLKKLGKIFCPLEKNFFLQKTFFWEKFSVEKKNFFFQKKFFGGKFSVEKKNFFLKKKNFLWKENFYMKRKNIFLSKEKIFSLIGQAFLQKFPKKFFSPKNRWNPYLYTYEGFQAKVWSGEEIWVFTYFGWRPISLHPAGILH